MQKRAIATIYGSLIFFILVSSIFLVITVNFFNYKQAVYQEHMVEDAKKQERILISYVNGTNPVSLTVDNTGTIDVRIRAMYLNDTFIVDPSTIVGDSYIAPSQSLSLNITLPLGLSYDNDSRIVVATERGTISKQFIRPQQGNNTGPSDYQSAQIKIGPVILMFDEFYYREISSATWLPGWSIPAGTYCSWKITIQNWDSTHGDITLDKYSNLRLVPLSTDPQNALEWYLDAPDWTKLLPYKGEFQKVIFTGSSPGSSSPEKYYPSGAKCLVFLVLLGTYQDGIPYGQTIPFEATIG